MRQYKISDFYETFNGCHAIAAEIAAEGREHQLWMCTRLEFNGRIVHKFQIRKGRGTIKATFDDLPTAIEEYNKCD